MGNHDAIERRAYELFEARGRTDGEDWNDWFQAERELAGPDVTQEQRADTPHDRSETMRRRRAEQVPAAV